MLNTCPGVKSSRVFSPMLHPPCSYLAVQSNPLRFHLPKFRIVPEESIGIPKESIGTPKKHEGSPKEARKSP